MLCGFLSVIAQSTFGVFYLLFHDVFTVISGWYNLVLNSEDRSFCLWKEVTLSQVGIGGCYVYVFLVQVCVEPAVQLFTLPALSELFCMVFSILFIIVRFLCHTFLCCYPLMYWYLRWNTSLDLPLFWLQVRFRPSECSYCVRERRNSPDVYGHYFVFRGQLCFQD
ncbi:uncharacterized protein LOC123319129 [Coccinella septempunctata]|uniref:uncharacterized protein LOC123319129 n=1 Tax=Coccinella septempunctata TaxID=41139 RepID=UPI001D085402|nr:uncharacterized protein LOC123319129 [Coccinella septempunctata]